MIEVVQAFDRTLIARLESDDRAALDRKIEAARRLFADRGAWLKNPSEDRDSPHAGWADGGQARASRAPDRVRGRQAIDDALIETDRAIDGVRNAVDELRVRGGREIPMALTSASVDRRAFTILEPIGVVAAILAFNHPLNLIVHQVVPAIAVGCPVIVKPAPVTPLSCIDFVGLLHEAGLPPDWCQVFLPETTELAEALATAPRIAFLSFIGSSSRRLVSTVQAGAGNPLRVGAWWCRAGDHRPKRRPRPADRAAGEGWVLPCRSGLRVGSAHLRPCGSRERVSRPLRRSCGGLEDR